MASFSVTGRKSKAAPVVSKPKLKSESKTKVKAKVDEPKVKVKPKAKPEKDVRRVISSIERKKKKAIETSLAAGLDLGALLDDDSIKVGGSALATEPKSDADFRQRYMIQLKTLATMIERLEQNFEASEGSTREVYAINALFQRMNEILAAVKNLKSPEERAQILTVRIMEPTFRKIVGELNDLVTDISRTLSKRLKNSQVPIVKEVIDEVVRRHARGMQTIYDDAIKTLLDTTQTHL